MQSRHAVIGDVRGGHGLFAVIELVADRATREPLSPWPQNAGRTECTGRRGAWPRACRSPPRQPDPAGAAAGDRRAGSGRRAGPARSSAGAILPRSLMSETSMSFRLTYATMFNPPRSDARALRGSAWRVEARARCDAIRCFIDGADCAAAQYVERQRPIDQRRACWVHFALADAADADAAMEAAHAAYPAWRATSVAERARLLRRVAATDRRTRLRHRRCADPRSGQEPHGSAGRSAGNGRFLPSLRRRFRKSRRLTTTCCPMIRSMAWRRTTPA